jgi:hypothetical protein
MPLGRCTAGIAVFALLISPASLPAQNGAAKSARTITAVRASEKVILDGVLNDRVWETALPATEFTQRDPDEGKPATERTELRVAYDDFNIYFGVRLFDTEPQKIVRQLSRRDNYADADTFTIQISPYHDRLTGAVFEVSAAGVQRDAIVSNDVFTDYSWEGVWESSVQVDELGWCLEIRVPFSQLRFPRAEHTYGNRYVFADIDQFQVSMTTRVNWTLSPRMSLQVFAQPLISVGDYWDFKEFARPKTFSFSRYGYDIGSISASANASPGEKRQYTVDPDGGGPGLPFTFDDPDFNLKSLRINAIFRWEWKLGSTLYFVWTENREDKSNPGQFSTRDIGRLFTAHANDIFLVRLDYWFTR